MLALSQSFVHAASPYGLAVSVAVTDAFGFQLPHVVVESDGNRELRAGYGGAYVAVVVGAGTEVA